MGLHLVGENLDKTRAHTREAAGDLVRLMRGIYVDASDDADEVVLRHAVRLGRYLYPTAYLSAASAVHLGPTPDGRLFLAGRRNQRTRIRSLEIIQNVAPPSPSLAIATVTDPAGELRVDVASHRQRFLEAFRLRSEHANAVDPAMRDAMAARLVQEYGDPKSAADACWALARENQWYREGEGAERFLLRRPVDVRNDAALRWIVGWHGRPLGTLEHDGFEWRWTARANIPLVRQPVPGKLPPFLASLLPEGWLERVLRSPDERASIRSGRRYLSNIAIVPDTPSAGPVPADVLAGRLADHTTDGLFRGTWAGPTRGEVVSGFEAAITRVYAAPGTPRLSGVQMKAPMYLDESGTLVPAIDRPFTHIAKPPGGAGFEALPVVEWVALELAREAGFDVPDHALVQVPDGPLALVVERFDIRVGPDDARCLALEDLCSAQDLPPSMKYDGTLERTARAVRAQSTEPEADVLILFRRALFAWLIGDGDLHLKNLAFLRVAVPGGDRFLSVRLAPVYDAVTTRVFPGLEADRMAMKVNGRDDHLTRRDFADAARTIGIRASEAASAMDNVAGRLRAAVHRRLVPSDLPRPDVVARIQEIVGDRARHFVI